MPDAGISETAAGVLRHDIAATMVTTRQTERSTPTNQEREIQTAQKAKQVQKGEESGHAQAGPQYKPGGTIAMA